MIGNETEPKQFSFGHPGVQSWKEFIKIVNSKVSNGWKSEGIRLRDLVIRKEKIGVFLRVQVSRAPMEKCKICHFSVAIQKGSEDLDLENLRIKIQNFLDLESPKKISDFTMFFRKGSHLHVLFIANMITDVSQSYNIAFCRGLSSAWDTDSFFNEWRKNFINTHNVCSGQGEEVSTVNKKYKVLCFLSPKKW